jgi:hypothetical protein
MRRVTFVRALVALGFVATAPSCGDGPVGSGEEEGVVDVTLVGARADDRAVLMELGVGVVSIEAAREDVIVRFRRSEASWVAAAFGPLAGAPVIRITVSDVNNLPIVAPREVSDVDGRLRDSLADYAARLDVR